MAEPAVNSRSLEERERELAATKVAPTIDVASEYERHIETVERGEAEAEDPWAFAGDNESIDSFISGCAPSCTAKAWIATQHDERKRRVEEYYAQLEGVEGAAGRESMEEISAAWEAAEPKTLEALSGVLKQHKYGCGKWMVLPQGQHARTLGGSVRSSALGPCSGRARRLCGRRGVRPGHACASRRPAAAPAARARRAEPHPPLDSR